MRMELDMTEKHRIASNRVYLDDNLLGLFVVEIKGKLVECYYALKEELPFTKWIQGEIFLQTIDNGIITVKEITST